MEVTVREQHGTKSWVISLPKQETIATLKLHLQDAMGAPPEFQTLSAGSQLSDDALISSLPVVFENSKSPYEQSNRVEVTLSYGSLAGGCPDEGFICCRCCGCATVIRPCECISRCFCFFSGCDFVDPNVLQCLCCRCYLCATDDQVERAAGHHT